MYNYYKIMTDYFNSKPTKENEEEIDKFKKPESYKNINSTQSGKRITTSK